MTFDGKVFGEEIVGAVRLYVAKVTDPLIERLSELERRLGEISSGAGQELDVSSIHAEIASQARAIAGDMVTEARIVANSAADELLRGIPVPQDGASVTLEDARPLIDDAVARAVASIPVPKDGQHGRDGVGLAGAVIDRDGNLVVTLTNGEMKNLGAVVGKDADQAAISRLIEEKVAAIPAPKDGKDGQDGRDGFNLEDFDATLMDDGRTILLSFDRGDLSYKIELAIPAMIYRGVYREAEYQRGDTVTWGGSLWHCDADGTKEKPGDGSKNWTLAAKRGRDGKDGVMLPAKAATPIRVGVPSEAK
ncbi:hypothetical protein [Rhizobium sp.]|uniref:hypothetical protein n=1 Tax=Rhizobium sp. TaxID=391 RepID=UPI0034C624FF